MRVGDRVVPSQNWIVKRRAQTYIVSIEMLSFLFSNNAIFMDIDLLFHVDMHLYLPGCYIFIEV